MGYVHRYGVTTVHSVAFCCSCCVLTCVISVFQTSDCGRRGAQINTSNIVTCYFITGVVVPQFALNVALKLRVLVLTGVAILGGVLLAVRLAIIGDDGALSADENIMMYIAVVFIYAGMTISLDYSQRSGFMSRRKLLRLVSSARGRHADMASQALDIMLQSCTVLHLLGADPHESQKELKIGRDRAPRQQR